MLELQKLVQSHIKFLENSQFVVGLAVSLFILSFFSSVTTTLQKKNCNLADAYHDIGLARSVSRF